MVRDNSFKLALEERQGVTQGTESEETLSTFLAESLGLTPSRGKGIVAIKLVQLFSIISGKREVTLKTLKGQEVSVKNGAMRVEDVHKWLQDSGVDIGTAQLYNTYITDFQRAGLITKKKYSMYGLKGDSLKEALSEVKRDWSKNFDRVLEHAVKLDETVRKK